MPPSQQNQYDFILSNNSKPRRSFSFGNSPGARIAIVVGGLILFIIAATIINSFLSRDAKAHNQRLTEIAQTQSEIVRVSALAAKDGKSQGTRNYALNTKLSVQSSQQELRKALNRRGVKDKSINKKLADSKNTKNDETLKEGGLNNRYDETFTALVNKQLADYQKLIQAAYQSSNTSEKKVLTASFENAGRLAVKQAASKPE